MPGRGGFNAAGADPAGDLGEDHTPETHLIPLVLDAMAGRIPYLQIFGDDYPSTDGTCIRDYIHVSDLADAHVLGLKMLLAEAKSKARKHVFNLGNGTGYSVQQVIEAAKATTGRGLLAHVAPHRPGDPPILVAAASKAPLPRALHNPGPGLGQDCAEPLKLNLHQTPCPLL